MLDDLCSKVGPLLVPWFVWRVRDMYHVLPRGIGDEHHLHTVVAFSQPPAAVLL